MNVTERMNKLIMERTSTADRGFYAVMCIMHHFLSALEIANEALGSSYTDELDAKAKDAFEALVKPLLDMIEEEPK